MNVFALHTPEDVARRLAERVKALRLRRNWKRATLAERSGVSEASVKRFERTGHVSLENLLKLAFTLDRLEELTSLFAPAPAASIEELESLQENAPKRGRV
ncbi:helix-turn-helix domain-containing protein [Desulfomicrobium salsuginis]